MALDFFNLTFLIQGLSIGVGVGLVSSFLGLGGGTLMVPVLTSLLGYDIKTSIASSLFVVFLNASMNTWKFHQQRLVRWDVARPIALMSLVFAFMGAQFNSLASPWFLELITVLIFSAIATLLILGPQSIPSFLRIPRLGTSLSVGAVAGTVASLTGTGGSMLLVPLFVVGGWTKNHEASPTGNALNMIATLMAFGGLLASGQQILWSFVPWILVGALLTGWWARPRQLHLNLSWRRALLVVYFISVIGLQIHHFISTGF